MYADILNLCTNSSTSEQNSKTEDWKISGISRKYPTYRKSLVITIQSWLKGKQTDDGAEGLWRIYDTLYDFSDFIERHPGGAFWLQQTKGTDITEPFESHHISTVPEKMLDKFKVRPAAETRNYKLTFNEKGFYRTLKGRVREKLKEIDQTAPRRRTHLMHLTLLLSTFIFTLASAMTGSIIFETLAALALCWLAIAAHNYFHQRDNWQMYTFNLTLMNFNFWRISHALSHHVYTNSLFDLEMSMFEPFLCWVPNKHYATKLQRSISLLVQPVFYAATFPFQLLIRLIQSLVDSNVLFWHDIIGFFLPALMLLVSDAPFLAVLRQWLFILMLSSTLFSIIGLNAAHHGPEIHHDGDANRLDRDWGLFQMDTVTDRGDIKSSSFLVLTHFGEHALHHLFPTLDHGVLPQLYPEFFKTLQEFEVELRESNHLQHIIAQNKQLLRTEPNPVAPGSKKNS